MRRASRLTPVTAVAAAVVLAALVQACGSHATNPYYPARSRVEIIDQEPPPGATGVNEHAKVEVEFGQDVDASTLDPTGGPPFTCGGSSGFLVCDPLGNVVKGTIDYNDRLAVFTASSALSASTTYQVLLKGVGDTRGLPLATAGTAWSFTVRTLPPLPSLLARVPLDRTGVPLNLSVRLELDQPIDPATLLPLAVRDGSVTGPALGGTTTWDPVGNAIVFLPSSNASSNTDYFVVVPAGMRDTLGRTLAAFTPLHFKTGAAGAIDVTRPTLSGAPTATESPSGSGNVVLHLPSASDAAGEWLPDEIRFEATVSKNRLSGPTCADPFDPQTFHLAAIGTSGDARILPPATVTSSGNLFLPGLDNGVWSFEVVARDGSGRDSLPSATGTVIVRAGGVTFADLKPVFAARCALDQCHHGAAPPGIVQLDDATDFVGTGHRSPTFENLPYVTPFCLEQSYVWRKIVPGYPIAGGLMPPQADDLQQLSRPQKNAIEQWILQGAN